MKKNIDDYLFNEAIKYLGKYPATKKKIEEYLKKKIKNKKTYSRAIFTQDIDKTILIKNIVAKLDNLKIINESHYLESMFNYYQRSLFSIRKIKSKLYQKGFDEKTIDEYISIQLQENPELEINILKKYIQKKRLGELEINLMKKKLYQQSFSENSIYTIIKK
jgi:SOS response regulatory protein OraA/RecX